MNEPTNIGHLSHHSLDPDDWEKFRSLAHRMLDAAIDHIRQVAERPVWKPMPDATKQALAEPPPIDGQGTKKVCSDLLEFVMPYSAGNIHPRFFGWVNGAGTAGGVIADLMSSAMNANLGAREQGANYVEHQVIAWFRQIFEFPATASGLIVTGTSMATLIALTVARFRHAPDNLRQLGVQPQERQLIGYTSAEAHSSIARAFDILGLGEDALHRIPVDRDYRMDIEALAKAIERDIAAGLHPFCVIGTAGTVNTGAVDDLAAIAAICRERDLWFHVDGAFGAAVILSDLLRSCLRGIEDADSIAFDFHKWMHVNYDAGMVLVRREDLHRQALTLRPDYLAPGERGLATGNPWFCEYGPEQSRGFRALKVWFLLKEHGLKEIARKIEDNCRQAAYLASRLEGYDQLELMAPVSLAIVCFRFIAPSLGEEALNRLNAEIVMDLQERGIAAPSTTTLHGRTAIRVNITNHRCTCADLDILVDALLETGMALVAKTEREPMDGQPA